MIEKVHIKNTLIAVFVVLLGCGGTLTEADCAWEGIHEGLSVPINRGNGLVSYRFDRAGYHGGGDSDWGQLETTFVDCSTGTFVTLRSFAQHHDASYKFNRSEEVEAILSDIPIGSAGETVDYLLEQAKAQNVPTRTEISDTEYCGCRVFYPELRNDKKTYEATL